MKWSEVAWLSQTDAEGAAVQLCDRLLESSLTAPSVAAFLQQQLPEIATEYSVQWAAVLRRTPDWQTLGECGRSGHKELPSRFLEESLDRDAGGYLAAVDPADWSMLTVPLQGEAMQGCLFLLAGRRLSREVLPAALVLGRALGFCLGVIEQRERSSRRINRLQSTLQIASSFASARETGSLLELIAQQATELLDCDRASIFIWDRDQHEVVACPALGVEGGTLRLPDDVGVVGEVVDTGRSVRVDDAYSDSRFDNSVDQASGYTTRNLLCGPLRDSQGSLIGAFEVINKKQGVFTGDDEQSLAELGVQAANALQNLKERERLIRSRQQLTERLTQEVKVIGESPAIVALRATIGRLATTDLPVLILGESGTGKEVVSQALHYQGPRADHPFIAVNCAALSETLLESELFGHEKGAFTDAHETRQGKFELAHEGTLFLDEIGDMSPGGQAKLLRVLEHKVVTRVGGSQTIPIDVRVVAATNTNLAEAVREKRFREDLYYRLTVVTLDLPALRDRPEDTLPLAEHFLARFCAQANRPGLEISSDARRRLQAHAWPGNVRELKNLMERVAFLCPGDRVEVDDLAFILSPGQDSSLEPSADLGLDQATKQFQREFVRRSVKRVGGNMSEAAKLLGVHRSNLYRKMRQLTMKEVGGAE